MNSNRGDEILKKNRGNTKIDNIRNEERRNQLGIYCPRERQFIWFGQI